MEIKPQNVTKMTSEQLYRLVVQKEIGAETRALVKEELVKREAEVLYNQAKRARPGELTAAVAGLPAKSPSGGIPGAPKKRDLSLIWWLLVIFIVTVVASGVYLTFFR